jgi:hypothetical protein
MTRPAVLCVSLLVACANGTAGGLYDTDAILHDDAAIVDDAAMSDATIDVDGPSGPFIPADVWTPTACTPMTGSQLVPLFPPGGTTYDFQQTYTTEARHRTCHYATGCTAWTPNASMVVHRQWGIGDVTIAPSTGGTIQMAIPSWFVIQMEGPETSLGAWCTLPALDAVAPFPCRVYSRGGKGEEPYWDANDTTPVALVGSHCADGTFHFATLVGGDSTEGQYANQIAFYGRLF